MPTGYTAGIIDGKITSFPQFAKQCMRAFGATIHMRDDSLDVEYTPRIPSDYHTNELNSALEKKEEFMKMSDDEIIEKRKSELDENKKRYSGYIDKAKENLDKLNSILADVEKWKPPTKDHEGLKSFMIEQIKITIDGDAHSKYFLKEIDKINEQLKSISLINVKSEMAAKIQEDIDYHTKELNAEIEQCNSSNKWVEQLFNSLTVS